MAYWKRIKKILFGICYLNAGLNRAIWVGLIVCLSQQVGTAKMVVILDPGHGGKSHGATYNGVEEKQLNLILAKELKTRLEREGIDVVLTRSKDIAVSLANRIKFSKRFPKGVFISLHYNAASNLRVKGVETFYYSPKSLVLAQSIHQEVVKQVKAIDRKVKKGNYYVLKYNQNPSILLECGFLSHLKERKKVVTPAHRKKLIEGIVIGLKTYLKL